MCYALEKLTIRGFKSIRELENFELRNLNVLIGANGAGKSNFISFFKMMQDHIDENNNFFRENGGVSNVLYNGINTTQKMEFEMFFKGYVYRLVGYPIVNNDISLSKETYFRERDEPIWYKVGKNQDAQLDESVRGQYDLFLSTANRLWRLYHFHDTGSFSPMRNWEIVYDDEYLRPNASNIAPYLYRLRREEESAYREIVRACRIAMPYFDDFLLKEITLGKADDIRKVSLSWRAKNTDFPMIPAHLSDGSIRFICIVTALMQPNPPPTMIFDEPELGLHPEAIDIIGELIKSAAERTRVIVATQSPMLVDQFNIEDIIVVNRKGGQSVFERLNKKDFDVWLENYAVGELWTKNVIEGGTFCE